MKRRVGQRLFGAVMTFGLLAAGPALAGGSGMPWEGPIQQVVQSITGPVVQAAAVIAVVLFESAVSWRRTSSSCSAIPRGVSTAAISALSEGGRRRECIRRF